MSRILIHNFLIYSSMSMIAGKYTMLIRIACMQIVDSSMSKNHFIDSSRPYKILIVFQIYHCCCVTL